MSSIGSINSLSQKYDNIIELSDKAYLVKHNKKFGVVYADGTVAIPVESTEFKHTNSIVILTDCINGITSVFSTTCNRYFRLPDMYRLIKDTNSIAVLREIRTSSGNPKTVIFNTNTMDEILEPSVVRNLDFDSSEKYIATFEIFNGGYKIDDVVYAISNNLNLIVISKNEITA